MEASPVSPTLPQMEMIASQDSILSQSISNSAGISASRRSNSSFFNDNVIFGYGGDNSIPDDKEVKKIQVETERRAEKIEKHESDYEMIKLWELEFESFPTLLLSSYVLLSKDVYTTSLIISMMISFCNLSLTLIKAIKKSKHFEYKLKLIDENSDNKESDDQNNNNNNNNNNSDNDDDDDEPAESKDKSSRMPAMLYTVVKMWKERSLYYYYFILWLFNVSDSFIRVIPCLMLIIFMRVNYLNNKNKNN